ncbi:MAG TPA: ComF family protein [Longimicrobiales bacterium]
MQELLRGLLDLLLPPVCLGCDKLIAPGDAARLICRRCRTLLREPPAPLCQRCGAPRLRTGRPDTEHCGECERWPTTLVHARSAFLLHPPADRIVHQIKYRGWHSLAPIMAAAMARVLLPDAMRTCDVVQAVPTTRSRVRERGYNQAGLIASSYAEQTRRMHVNWLERAPASSSQTTLQPAKRAANVSGAFRVSAEGWNSIPGARILVIDDVLTTGATVAECTETLAAAGAASVCVLTYARALDTNRLLGS